MILPARIRFDDAVILSNSPKLTGKELEKFVKNVNWCKRLRDYVILTPAILCQDIEKVPGAIHWMNNALREGLIFPDLHGWDHGPYGPPKTQPEIEEHLDKALNWFHVNLGVAPIRWVTPHGADSSDMRAAAANYNLVIETTEYPVVDQKELDARLRRIGNVSEIDDLVIMNHWWERGLSLYRIARIIEYQDIATAIKETRSELTVKDHNICWNGWNDA